MGISRWRVNLLRAAFGFMFLGLVMMVWRGIIAPHEGIGHAETAMRALLGGVSVLALIGIFRPLEMLPLMLFEFVWKAIWIVAFGLPLWRAGTLTGDFAETMFNCLIGIVFTLVLTPWDLVFRKFISGTS